MDTNKFNTRDEYLAQIKEANGETFALIAQLACQLIAFDRMTQAVIADPTPEKVATYKVASGTNFGAAMSTITKIAGMSDLTAELAEASEMLFMLTRADVMLDSILDNIPANAPASGNFQ